MADSEYTLPALYMVLVRDSARVESRIPPDYEILTLPNEIASIWSRTGSESWPRELSS